MDKNNKEISNIKDATKKRTLAFNSIAAVTVVIVIAIAVVFNIIFANVVNSQIDLTENKDFSMSDEAREEVKKIDKEVEIVGLFDDIKQELNTPSIYENTFFTDLYLQGQLQEGSYYYSYYMSSYSSILPYTSLANLSIPAVMGVLSQFANMNSNIKVSYVDPDSNTLFVKNFVSGEQAKDFKKGDFIVKCGNIVKRVTSADLCRKMTVQNYHLPYAPNIDGGFLSAILYVTAEKRPVIGAVINHGEDNLTKVDETNNYTVLKESLEENVFKIKDINITTEKLDDIDILLFLNPKNDITVTEADTLVQYLNKGGNLIAAIDPGQDSPEFTNLNSVLAKFNLKINNDLIHASEEQTATDKDYGIFLPIVPALPEVLAGVFTSNPYVFIPKARSITYFSNETEGLKSTTIIQTDKNAYTSDYTTGTEIQGIKSIGSVSAYTSTGGSKVMVLGSSVMLADTINTAGKVNPTAASSVEAVVRICSWMEKSVNYTLPVKKAESKVIAVPEASASLLGWISILLMPLLAFAIGIFIWVRRRHL